MSYLSIPYEGTTPNVSPDAFVAPDATLIGDVTVGAGTSIWFKCVLRGDSQPIAIGRNCNIQDGTVVHIGGSNRPTFIGDNVSAGHMVLIHDCTVESGGFVGMKGIVMDGAVMYGPSPTARIFWLGTGSGHVYVLCWALAVRCLPWIMMVSRLAGGDDHRNVVEANNVVSF